MYDSCRAGPYHKQQRKAEKKKNIMDDIIGFGFEDADEVVTQTSFDKFVQAKGGNNQIAIISFNKHHDVVLRRKTREAGRPLTAEERTEIISAVDAKLMEKLGKSELSETDRLDLRSPKFWSSFTHFDDRLKETTEDRLGTFRCLSKFENGQIKHREACCKRFGEPAQRMATVIMSYPVDKNGDVDVDLLLQRKYTDFYIWAFTAKKYKDIERAYSDARGDGRDIINLRVKLDGDEKFQKQIISPSRTPVFASPDFDAEIREWILDQGLRGADHVGSYLGYKVKIEKMLESLNRGAVQITSESTPKLNQSYEDMI